jgi:O-antigen chain-terminating methyltransferase
MKKVRKFITRIPIIGYMFQMLSRILLLPRHLHNFQNTLYRHQCEIDSLQELLIRANLGIIEGRELNNLLSDQVTDTIRRVNDMSPAMSPIKDSKHEIKNASSTKTLADDHRLDKFYLEFENKFRGTESDILERLDVYLSYFLKIKSMNKYSPILDIGCGRGEFLQFMKNNNFSAIGLDLNGAMVESAKSKGFEAFETDALSYLSKRKKQSLSAITGFHLVEHIYFSDLLELFTECYRTLNDEGFVLFETPNPENLTVGAFRFYYDPSHLKPIPPKLLQFCLSYVGFRKVEIMPLHPEIEGTYDDKDFEGVMNKLYGPQDYAVIAFR